MPANILEDWGYKMTDWTCLLFPFSEHSKNSEVYWVNLQTYSQDAGILCRKTLNPTEHVCVCIEVQTLWPSKKTKENSGHKRETFKIDYIPNLKSASLMDRRKLLTWNAPSLTWHVNCPSNCSFNSTHLVVGKKTSSHHPIIHIQAFNGFLKCMTWGLPKLKDWLQQFGFIKSPTVFNPYFQHHWKCLKKVKVIHGEMNLDHQKCMFMCVKRATPWLSNQSLGNPNLQNMQTCFWSSATREVWALLAPLRPSRSSLPARRQLDTKDIYGFNIYMFCTFLVLWVILNSSC